jgi:hypothetical protein
MKITIDNRTHWRSDHIRAFVKRILPNERAALCKRGAPTLVVRVVWNRGGDRYAYVSGCASYFSNRITLKLASGAVDKIDLAHTIAHELAHTRGMKHPEMTGDPLYTRSTGWRELYAWAEALPLDKEATPRKTRPDANTRLTHAQGMLAKALKRERRAQTIRKKWQRRVKASERAAAMILPEAAQGVS